MKLTSGVIIALILGAALVSLPRSGIVETFQGSITTADNGVYAGAVEEKIRQARKHVCLIMFSARYYNEYPDSPGNRILRELVKAKERGVKVEVIFERSGMESQSDLTRENMNTGAYLAKKGLAVYFDSEGRTTHSKLFVIDGRYVIIGSANLTYSALAKNNETSVIIESEKLALHYLKYFENVRKECTFILKPAQ